MKTLLIILSAFLFSCVTKNYITNNYYPENKIPVNGFVQPFYSPKIDVKTLEHFIQTPYVSTMHLTPDFIMNNTLKWPDAQFAPNTFSKTLEFNNYKQP